MIYLDKWLKYYYETWFSQKPQIILAEFIKYIKGSDSYDDDLFA